MLLSVDKIAVGRIILTCLAEDQNFDGFNAKDTFSGEAQGVYRSFVIHISLELFSKPSLPFLEVLN